MPEQTELAATDAAFDILGCETLHDGFVKLRRYTVRQKLMRGGSTPPITREISYMPDVSAVLLYDPDRDKVVLIQQARLVAQIGGFTPFVTEIVAGLIEPGETPEELALREVQEESGCTIIGALIPMMRIMMSSGNLHQPIHVFCGRVDASIARGYHGLAEEHEDIRVIVLDFAEFSAALLASRYEHALLITAGYWLLAHRASLQERWRAPAPEKNP